MIEYEIELGERACLGLDKENSEGPDVCAGTIMLRFFQAWAEEARVKFVSRVVDGRKTLLIVKDSEE